MKVIARYDLARETDLDAGEVLLLEGSWPIQHERPRRYALDDCIDSNMAWIDEDAAELAEQVASGDRRRQGSRTSFAWLNILKLRYYLVKLLRVAAFFDEHPLAADLECVLQRGRDEAYAYLLREICRTHGRRLEIVRIDRTEAAAHRRTRKLSWMRRLAAACDDVVARRTASGQRRRSAIVLCGNPKLLDPVCEQFLSRGHAVWHASATFPLRHWGRWRSAGVRQYALEGRGAAGRFRDCIDHAACDVMWRGVRLGPAIEHWLAARCDDVADRQAEWMARLATLFGRVRPAALVIDEDATPLKRVAVAAARALGTPSVVIQHGVPAVRFGFAPMAADHICVWNEASRTQLVHWGIAHEQITVTGSPAATALANARAAASTRRSPSAKHRVLLLTTTPPSDERPDAVSYHLTTRTFDRMLEAVAACVQAIPELRLVVRPHPRTPSIAWLIERFALAGLRHVSVDRRKRLADSLGTVDCVISCGSSAGIEAASAGWPVVQLLPEGSCDLLPAARFDMVGTARTAGELIALVRQAVLMGASRPAEFAGATAGPTASERIVDVVERLSTSLRHRIGEAA